MEFADIKPEHRPMQVRCIGCELFFWPALHGIEWTNPEFRCFHCQSMRASNN